MIAAQQKFNFDGVLIWHEIKRVWWRLWLQSTTIPSLGTSKVHVVFNLATYYNLANYNWHKINHVYFYITHITYTWYHTHTYTDTHGYTDKLCVYITNQVLMLTSTPASHTASRVSIYSTSTCVDISLFLYIFSISKPSNYEVKDINNLI